MADLTLLEAALHYTFHNRSYLKLALTHPSCGPENNQRLEFLGDAVLQLAMGDFVFSHHPELEEGGLTFLRARMVREETLCAVARSLHLGSYLKLNHGSDISGERERPAVLADAMEAVLAAVYLDAGYEQAAKLVNALWPDEKAVPIPVTDCKTELQELLQGKGLPCPEYKTLSEEGPAHMRTFTVAVYSEEKELGRGEGNRKKRAEQAAAEAALRYLKSGEDAR